MGGLTCHLRVKALKSTVALPAVFLALCPVAAYADTVSVSGDPFTDPSATATAGPNSDFGNSASAYGVQPIPSVNMNNGGSATASATAEQSFSLPVFSPLLERTQPPRAATAPKTRRAAAGTPMPRAPRLRLDIW
jgi:hypothetical protein